MLPSGLPAPSVLPPDASWRSLHCSRRAISGILPAAGRRLSTNGALPVRGLRAAGAFFYFSGNIAVAHSMTYAWRMLAVAQGIEVRHG